MKQDRRRVQRITLDSPIPGSLSKQIVKIVDLSTTGARIEHSTPIAGRKVADLRFHAEGEDLGVSCNLVRSRLQRSALDRGAIVYSSGLRFNDPAQESIARIRAIVASLLERRAVNQHATADALSVAV